MIGTTCGLDLKFVPPGEGVRDNWGRAFCGESCWIGYIERTAPAHVASHSVPDPRYHRTGDGWRSVTRWIARALPMGHRHGQHPRRDRRAPARPR